MTEEANNDFAEQLKQLDSEQFHEGEPYKLDAEGNVLKGEALDANDEDDVHPEADEQVNENEPESGVQDDDDDDEEVDPDEEEEDDPDEEEEDEGKDGGKKLSKSAQLTRALRQTRRELAETRRKVAGLEAANAAPKNADGSEMTAQQWAAKQLETDEKAPKKPDPLARDAAGNLVYALGRFDEAYTEEYADYRDARKDYLAAKTEEFKKDHTSATASAAPGQQDELVRAVEAFAADDKGVPGFKEAVKAARANEWPLSEVSVRLALESPVGREIAAHLHQNPKLAKELAGLPEIQQAARFGKLEAQISAEVEAKKKAATKPSSAPKPTQVKTRGGGGTAPPSFASEDFGVVERRWKQQQNAQVSAGKR